MEAWITDLRHALSVLRRSPRLTLGAVLMLALGIGTTTSVFSVVSGVLLTPLPFEEPERLEFLTREGDVSIPDVVDWRKDSHAYQHIALFLRNWTFDLTGDGEPQRLTGMVVEPEYFEVLGMRPRLGRVLADDDNKMGGGHVAVISEGLWKRRFGGDAAVLGRTIRLSDNPTTIVGVMPRAFDFLGDGIDLWTPVAVETPWAMHERGTNNFDAIGRLVAGVSHDQARAEMIAITQRLAQEYVRTNRRKIVEPLPMLEFMVGRVRPALVALLVAVALVLLVACANLAGLLLARQTARQGELALRLALGAGRARLARQALAEGVLLAALGGGLGVLLTWFGRDMLLAAAPQTLPRLEAIGVDLRVLAFALVVTLAAGLLAGLLPALHLLHRDPAEFLRSGRSGGLDPARTRALGALVSAEVGLACLVLVGAGLLTRTFLNLMSVPLGFEPTRALRASIVLPETRYAGSELQSAAFARIVESVATIPGVEAAATVMGGPLEPRGGVGNKVLIENEPPVERGREPGAAARAVHGDYFRALGIPILQGRLFAVSDDARAPKVALVNERLARELFPNRSPIGQRIAWRDWNKGQPGWMAIVGVVGDIKSTTLEERDFRAVYYPYVQRTVDWQRFGTLIVRAKVEQEGVARQVQQAVWSVDPNLPLADVQTLLQRSHAAAAQRRFSASALGLFAAAALLVALHGLYTVLAYAAQRRRREIGVRMALGATGGDVLRLVIGHGLRLTLAGACCGFIAALALARLLGTLLLGVPPTDPLTYAAVGAFVIAAALAACGLPARKASRIEPMEALRYE